MFNLKLQIHGDLVLFISNFLHCHIWCVNLFSFELVALIPILIHFHNLVYKLDQGRHESVHVVLHLAVGIRVELGQSLHEFNFNEHLGQDSRQFRQFVIYFPFCICEYVRYWLVVNFFADQVPKNNLLRQPIIKRKELDTLLHDLYPLVIADLFYLLACVLV